MIDSVPLIQNANDAQQINASIIAMKKASRELNEKIVKLNSLNSELDKKIALLDSGLNKEIEDRKEAINSLDVPSVGGSGKYISAISETDGKINATASDLATSVTSGNSQPVTSGGVADAIDSLGITNIGTSSFRTREYKTIVNNTDYEFADISAVANSVIALVSISTISLGNVCTSLWLISTGNQNNSCSIILLCKTGYMNNNNQKLTVNFDTGGSCSLVIKLGSVGNYVGNPQGGYISVLCFNGRLTLKEKTTTLTSRSYTKYLETEYTNTSDIATDTLIKGTITNSQKNAVSAIFQNLESTAKYYKISGLFKDNRESVFLLQARAGELCVISTGYAVSGQPFTIKIKKLLDTYSKINGFTFSGSDVFVKISAYSQLCILSQLSGNEVMPVSVTETTQATYNAGTPITIET